MADADKDDLDKEAEKFFNEEQEKAVDDIQKAYYVDRAMDVILAWIKEGYLDPDMTLIEALRKIEKRKCELVGLDTEEGEDGDEEKDESDDEKDDFGEPLSEDEN